LELQRRARQTRRQQLRVAGREVIQEPSGRAFGVLSAPFQVQGRTDILPESELKEELERTRGFVTFRAPKRVERKKGEIITTRRQLIIPSIKPTKAFRQTIKIIPFPERRPSPTELRFEAFEQGVQSQRQRQLQFGTSAGFERIENVAGAITGGLRFREGRLQVLSIEDRGPVGGVAQALVRDIAGFPIAVGGGIAGGVEKLKLTGEALGLGRQQVSGGFIEVKRRDIAGEFVIEAPRRIITEFQALPRREKIATGLFIATAPFLGGGPVRQFLAKRVTRTKAIKDLSPKDLKKFESFEVSVGELKGVRPKTKIINLREIEGLSPKAAAALDRVILRRKQELVVGGSVAQRTQITGQARKPGDIDLFTSGNKKQLLEEFAKELREAGVERVSVVRGKQITIEGKKKVEVKELSLLEQNIKKVQLPFQRVGSAFTTTPRGVRVLRLGAQAQRKLIGGFGLEQERIRAKDVSDLPVILRQLRKSKAGSLSRRPKLREPFSLPSRFPKPLRTESSSLVGRRRGEPSGLGGPFISKPSILKVEPRQPSPVSTLTQLKKDSSVLKPTKARPSVLRPFDISKITPKVSTLTQLTPFQDTSSPRRIPPFKLELPKPKDEKKKRNVLETFRRGFRGTPSLSVVLGGAGVELTKAQIVGKASISPLLIRQIGNLQRIRRL